MKFREAINLAEKFTGDRAMWALDCIQIGFLRVLASDGVGILSCHLDQPAPVEPGIYFPGRDGLICEEGAMFPDLGYVFHRVPGWPWVKFPKLPAKGSLFRIDGGDFVAVSESDGGPKYRRKYLYRLRGSTEICVDASHSLFSRCDDFLSITLPLL